MFATTEQYVYLTNTELTDIDSVFVFFLKGKRSFTFFKISTRNPWMTLQQSVLF